MLIREEVGPKIIRLYFLTFVLACAIAISSARASAPQDNLPGPSSAPFPPNCGQSVDDALKAARAALARDDADHQRAALACLIAAVSALNAERLDAMRGEASAEAHVLAVPKDSGNGR